MQITGRCSISVKTVITNWKQKLGKTKHAGSPERTALELICQRKELNSKDTLCWEKYGEIQGKISTSYLAKKSSIKKQGNKAECASGRSTKRAEKAWQHMATCHLISSECSYHIGRRYENAPIYPSPVLGRHITTLPLTLAVLAAPKTSIKMATDLFGWWWFLFHTRKRSAVLD